MNELAKIVNQSGLESADQTSILERFGSYEEVAKEWEAKAKMIVVTDSSQTTEMAMAKEARKKFSQLRIDVEKARKAMKEQSLRKGQAIDSIARFLVSLILPIEEYLRSQEDFVRIEHEKKLAEEKKKDEEEAEKKRLADEEKERLEQERIRKENKKLKQEAEKRELELKAEREAKERAEAEKQRILDEQEKAKHQKEQAEKKRLEDIEEEKRVKASQVDSVKFNQYIDDLLAVETPELTEPEYRQRSFQLRTYISGMRNHETL